MGRRKEFHLYIFSSIRTTINLFNHTDVYFNYQGKFFHESSGIVVSREQLMMVLSYIESLHIRASYYSRVSRVRYVMSTSCLSLPVWYLC